MSEKLNIVVTRVQMDGTTGNLDITDTNLAGMTPKAMMVFASDTSFDTDTNNMESCIGFATAADDECCAGSIDSYSGNPAAVHVGRSMMTDKIMHLFKGQLGGSGTNFAATLVQFIPDGVRINVSVGTAAPSVTFIFFAGTEVADVHVGTFENVTEDLEVDVTDPGFEPDLIFAVKAGEKTVYNAVVSQLDRGFGFAYKDSGDAIHQYGVGHHSDDVTYTTSVVTVMRDDSIAISGIDVNSIAYEIEVGNFDSDGFSTWCRNGAPSADSSITAYLAIKFGARVPISHAEHTTNTSAATKATTGVGFEPVFCFSIANGDTAFNNVVTDNSAPSPMISAGTVDEEGVHNYADEDAVALIYDTAERHSNALIMMRDENLAALDEGTLDSFDADGFTIDYTTADGTARMVASLLIGDSVPLEEVTPVIIGCNF